MYCIINKNILYKILFLIKEKFRRKIITEMRYMLNYFNKLFYQRGNRPTKRD